MRFSHTIFALPFAALAVVLSLVVDGVPQLSLTTVLLRCSGVLLCMVSARSAAMAFNRLVDAKIDAANPRTASRHIPSGELARWQVTVFFGAMCAAFVGGCGLFWPNWLPIALSVFVLAWICGYSLAKRFTSAAHLWLGVALAMSPICAWVAMRGEAVLLDPRDILPAIGLGAAIAFWVAGFDIIYACQDAQFDRDAKLHSVPARFGVAGALRIAMVFHVLMLLILGGLPFAFPQLSFSWIYLVGYAVVAALVVRQHSIVSADDMRRVGEAFFTINAVISFGLCAAAALDSVLR
ncbi:MAG: putative 4-hydroxybenzoate polyprenyltransferase [Aureliella sp.]